MNIISPLHSLQGRLLIASVLVLPLVLLIAGFALNRAYSYSLENAVQDRLQLQVYLLLGSAELNQEYIRFPEHIQEPRFNQIGSGLYASIHNPEHDLLWRSLSTALMAEKELSYALDFDSLEAGSPAFGHDPQSQLYRFRLRIIYEGLNNERDLVFTVMESDAQVLRDIKAYNQQLALWLSIIFLVALLAQTFILRWGLQPLTKLAIDLKSIESGEAERLSGSYPDEVQPVTDNLNLLLQSERQQRERYRNTLADLAHSLKTPLAVVRGAGHESGSENDYQQLVDEQVARMDQIVQYQLSRAVQSDHRPLAKAVAVKPLVERMLSALGKVYRHKQTQCSVEIPTSLGFQGDERDLMEVLGNILENAFKYGHSQVAISAKQDNGYLQLCIDDDGTGVSSDMRQVILQRGARLDTSLQEGQGIGLSVVTDIISSYQGEIEVSESHLGGARFILRFPIS